MAMKNSHHVILRETSFARHYQFTLKEAIQTFCARKLEGPDYRPSTRQSYRKALQEFLRACTHLVSADQLDLASVQHFDQELERRRMRASSRRVKIAAVKAFICYLEQEAILSPSVARSITLPRQEHTDPARPVDVDDAAALMLVVKQAHNPLHVAVMTILLGTGIMASELTELTLADLRATPLSSFGIGLEQHLGAITSATWSSLRLRGRAIPQRLEAPLDYAASQALSAYLAVRPRSPYWHLFLSASGAPLTIATVGSMVKRYAQAAGMPWVHARAIRSGYVLRQLAAGTPLPEVQEQIGHRRIVTTRRYTGLLRSSARGATAHRRTCGILIVDARQQTRRQLRLLLEGAGHQVFEAFDVVGTRDMLRLSRLALVVVVSLWSPLEDNGDDLSDLVDLIRDGHPLVDHRFIFLPSGGSLLPSHVVDLVTAHNIPILSRRINLEALLKSIAHAYDELGAQG
jgi:integrase/recombinase XerC